MKKIKDKLFTKFFISKTQLSPELKNSFKTSFGVISLGLVLLGFSLLSNHHMISAISITLGLSMFTLNLFFWEN